MSNDAPATRSPRRCETKYGAAALFRCDSPMPDGLNVSSAALGAAVLELAADEEVCRQGWGDVLDRLTGMLGVDMRPKKDRKLRSEISIFVSKLYNHERFRQKALKHVCSLCNCVGHYESEFLGQCAVGSRCTLTEDDGSVREGTIKQVRFGAGEYVVAFDGENETRTIGTDIRLDPHEAPPDACGLRVLARWGGTSRDEAARSAEPPSRGARKRKRAEAKAKRAEAKAARADARRAGKMEPIEAAAASTTECCDRRLKDPYGERARAQLGFDARPPCVVCSRTSLPADRMSFCGACRGFACDDGFARHCGFYFAPRRDDHRHLLHSAMDAEMAARHHEMDMADYNRACELRGEYPEPEKGLFTCYPCAKILWQGGDSEDEPVGPIRIPLSPTVSEPLPAREPEVMSAADIMSMP